MATQLQLSNIGNQVFKSQFNGILYQWSIQWNDRVSRYYLTVKNLSTDYSTAGLSMEPFSTLDTKGLGFPEDQFLVTLMITARYDSEGALDIKYEDIGVNLKLVIASALEIESYGPLVTMLGVA